MVQSQLLLKFPDLKHVFLGKKDQSNQLDFDIKSCKTSQQVHRNTVLHITNSSPKKAVGDAMITKTSIPLGIQTADCIPILLYDPGMRFIGTIHAGWKGLDSGVIHQTIHAFQSSGSDTRMIVAAIGPSIGACCYDVPFERIALFQRFESPEYSIAEKRGEKWYLNLKHVALLQLLKEGLTRQHIEDVSICTRCHSQFFSYRRGIAEGQRNMSIIQMI